MKNSLQIIALLVVLQMSYPALAQTEGFYKDLFMDGGVSLTSRTSLPAATSLGYSMEYLATGDEARQADVMIQNALDDNGYLLYPDGSPRFRCIYTNGGGATNHGNSLGEVGRSRIRDFYYNGGSYSGSCAGAFIASMSYMSSGVHEPYYHIWPGRSAQPSIADVYTGHVIEANSPLLEYYDFGEDMYIANVYHNLGPYPREQLDYPAQTEILTRFDHPGAAHHEKGSSWAYKDDSSTGRIVVVASHPEGVTSGERLQFMKALLHYALDGLGSPVVKGSLENGSERVMDKFSGDNDPAFTRIGDRQYHHFTIDLPKNVNNLAIDLNGNNAYSFNLYMQRNEFAFESTAEWQSTTAGPDHTLSLTNPEPGLWYIGVECESTVQTTLQSWGYEYTKGTGVLNGVSYSMTASWNPLSIKSASQPESMDLLYNYPNPFNPTTTISYTLTDDSQVQLLIYDLTGRIIHTLLDAPQPAGSYNIQWNGMNEFGNQVSTGVYFCRLQAGSFHQTIKMVYLP